MKLNFLYRRYRRLYCHLLTATFLLSLPQFALAQGQEEAETQAAWLLPYCLVGLLVGLSVYSMCRPSYRRKQDIK